MIIAKESEESSASGPRTPTDFVAPPMPIASSRKPTRLCRGKLTRDYEKLGKLGVFSMDSETPTYYKSDDVHFIYPESDIEQSIIGSISFFIIILEQIRNSAPLGHGENVTQTKSTAES